MSRTREGGRPPASLRQIAIPSSVRALNPGARGLRAFLMGECQVLVAREPLGRHGELEWHLSISCEDRYPSWDEIGDARDRLLPADEPFGMVLPASGEYVNAHPFTFHLHRLPDWFAS